MKAAPTTGPSVVLMPPRITITRMLTETVQLNWPGETMPWKAKTQPASARHRRREAEHADLDARGARPAAAANGSASRIASSTG